MVIRRSNAEGCERGCCSPKQCDGNDAERADVGVERTCPISVQQVWVKPSSEMGFLYGNHVTKVGLGRITENTTQNQGVVIFSMADIPLGFGVAAKSTQDCRKLDPGGIVAYHQSDVGEYLRNEEEIG